MAIAAVGTTALALQYGEVRLTNRLASAKIADTSFDKSLILSLFFGRYPDYMKTSMWCGLVMCTGCLFLSSFATHVSEEVYESNNGSLDLACL